MGVFGKLGQWLTEKRERYDRGGAAEGGYYATSEARQAYGGTGEEGYEDENAREALDPFGHGNSEYGGRQRYVSRYDAERNAQQAAQVSSQPQTGYQQPQAVYQQPQAGYQQLQQGYQQPQQGYQPQPVYQQPQASYQQQQDFRQPRQQGNVVPFPGMQRGTDGSVYAHVEYVVLLRNRNECKDVIACIKANASVFLNMEFIASDSERQRCVDMLSGAAYTLGCALNKISPRGIYLISSPSVRVVLDPALQKFGAAPEAQGFAAQPVHQRHETDGYGRPQVAQPSQPAQPDVQEAQQPANGFVGGSPTMRFQAQASQRMPTSFGSVMAGNATGMYRTAGNTGHFAAVQQ